MKQTVVGLMWIGINTLTLACADTILRMDRVDAQVIPDSSLATTVTTPNNLDFTIDGGTRSGNNLFHSFSQLSIPTGGSALFNNATDIQTIFARVTGGNASNIDGLLQANGTANLFLLNPSGILFGANAQLNVGGSFVGTTANSIQFADGTEFSAVNPSSAPLLTMSAPVGLQMGQSPGTITNLASAGLGVQPGQTISLIGGDILFQGGGLYSPSSTIELGGVGAGSFVGLTGNGTGWNFDYSRGQDFRTISLAQSGFIITEGVDGGTIHITGGHLLLDQQAFIYSATYDALSGGDITLSLKGSIQLDNKSYIGNDIVDGQQGGAIRIQVPQLLLQNQSGIATTSWGTGNAGIINMQSNSVQVHKNSQIGSYVIGSGNGGNVLIQAQDVSVSGVMVLPDGSYGWSAIATSTQGTGNAGKLQIETQRLVVQDGGVVGASTFATGNAGSIRIQATESVQILGTGGTADLPSAVRAEVRPGGTGNGGNIFLTTGTLSVAGGGMISVSNNNVGNAGSITLSANQVRLKDGGTIQAKVNAGNQGNINLNARLLVLRNESSITTSAGDLANGGNINLNVPIIVGLENSDIVANAVRGQGGNIQITTQGIIGLQYRDRLTSENDITASSEFGVNGTVEVNNVGVDPNSGLVELSTTLIDSNQQVAAACSGNEGSSFVITGRGGIPQNPTQAVSHDRSWNDMRDLSAFHKSAIAQTPTAPPTIAEATTWYRNPQTGKVELVAARPTYLNPSVTCASKLHPTGNSL
jgi:filamentous hemagglutinin family protein